MSATTPTSLPRTRDLLRAFKSGPAASGAWFGVVAIVATTVVVLAAAAAVLV